MVLVLCTSSGEVTKFHENISKVFELFNGHEIMTDRLTDKVITIGLRRLCLAGPY